MITTVRGKFRAASVYLNQMRRRSEEGGISVARQMLEVAFLWSRNGVRPLYYFRAGFYRRGIGLRKKLEHVDGERYLKMVRRINPEGYNFVVMNKIVSEGVLRSFDIPTPPFYGLVNAASGQTFDGKPLCTSNDLQALIDRVGVDQMCFKLLGGWSGKGFILATFERRSNPVVVVRRGDGTRMTLEEFWHTALAKGKGPAYICQGVIRQHDDVAAFHPSSVNTARVWMYQPEPGRWEMFGAILRMGVNRSCVDNTSAGGITARIDVASGVLDAAVDPRIERQVYSHHPTTGVRVEGRVLPMWDDALKLSARACRAFPYFRFLALDVAFGCQGPLVIEIESEPGAGHQMAFERGIRSLFAGLDARGPLDWRV